MKNFRICVLSTLLTATTTSVMAGGILTNTNQSIDFLRNPARDAAIGIDGVYSLYWWCRGFDALSVFRVPNAIYSAPLYFLLGFAMNLEFRQSSERKETCHG